MFESILRADAGQTRKDRAILRVIGTTPWTPTTTHLFLQQIVRIMHFCPSARTRLQAASLTHREQIDALVEDLAASIDKMGIA